MYGCDEDHSSLSIENWNYFELDLTNIKQNLGSESKHDLASILNAAEAMRRGEDVGIIPTGVRFG